MYDRVLVGIDDSDDAERAIEYALRAAEQAGAELHALFVVDTRRFGETALSSYELFVDEVEDQGHDLLAALSRRADERGLDVATRCCHAVPDEEVRAYAAAVDADLLVAGYRGRSHSRPGRFTADPDVPAGRRDPAVALV
jgi:nucleotide-binding universal stress UspA family protein